jgi:hypothetical protein
MLFCIGENLAVCVFQSVEYNHIDMIEVIYSCL